jgi:hypothetical protein
LWTRNLLLSIVWLCFAEYCSETTTENGWKNLGTDRERHKENRQQPSTWTKPVKQIAKGIPAKIEQPVEIFVDEDLEQEYCNSNT